MSRLEDLIAGLCPDGVEYKLLWEITTWDKHFKSVERFKQTKVIKYPYFLVSDLPPLQPLQQNDEDVYFLSTGAQSGWISNEIAGENICEGEVVTLPGGGSPETLANAIKYYKGKFVTADNRIATSNDTNILLNKFLYYWMKSEVKTLGNFYRGGGIKHPNMGNVLNMLIPVPPIEVQREVVRILDSFTELTLELTAELTSELTARKQQYEYYRDTLLNFDNTDNSKGETLTLGEIGKISMCKRIMKSETSPQGDVPFYKIGTFGGMANAFISKETFEKYKKNYSYPNKGDILISAAGTIGRAVIFDGEPAYFQDSNIVWIANDESRVLNKYLYYYYQLQPWKASTGGTIARLYNDNIAKTKIFVPPLETQQRIVSILDRFDALCNDLTSGIPAEIEAREKQYEYYRDKLLTFKRKQAGA